MVIVRYGLLLFFTKNTHNLLMKRPVLKYCFSMLFCCLMAQISFSQARGEDKITFDFDDCPEITIKNITGALDLPQHRVLIGVGKVIELSVSNLKTNWSVVKTKLGLGTLIKKDDYIATFEAPIIDDEITIEADIQSEKCIKKLRIRKTYLLAQENLHLQ